jgi:uncharacterized membrane protein HdeD (DUF308 family)
MEKYSAAIAFRSKSIDFQKAKCYNETSNLAERSLIMAKKKKNSELSSALLYILLGVLLIVFRGQTLDWAMTIAGVIFIVSGVLDIVRRNFVGGAISLIIGIAILVLGWTATKIVLLVLGVLLAIKGLFAFVDALKRKRSILALIFPILNVVVGLVIAFGNGLDIIIMVCGVLLVIDGVLGLLASLKK